jgi:hypothetical protein
MTGVGVEGVVHVVLRLAIRVGPASRIAAAGSLRCVDWRKQTERFDGPQAVAILRMSGSRVTSGIH